MSEPIEKWKEEARNYIESLPSSIDGWSVSDVEKAYISAKRSTPVVELPEPFHDSISGYECDELHESLIAAGIKYRIKGE